MRVQVFSVELRQGREAGGSHEGAGEATDQSKQQAQLPPRGRAAREPWQGL